MMHASISVNFQPRGTPIKKYPDTPKTLKATPDESALRLSDSWNDSHSAHEIAASIRKVRSTNRFQEVF